MSLLGLRYFLAAAEEMNIRRAAEKLYITQQTLSAHVQKLERQYNVQLFERRPRLMLTPAGEALAEYARRALRLEDSFQAELADLSNTATGKLNVGISGIRGTIFIPRIWEIFHREFPNISLALNEGGAAQLDTLLTQGKLDLYIGVDAPVRADTEVLSLSREKACCAASKEFVRKYFTPELIVKAKDGIELSDIADMPLVTFTLRNSIRRVLDEYFAVNGIHPHIIIETYRHDLVFRFCKQGYGIGVIYQMILYDSLQNSADTSGLCVFPIRGDHFCKETHLVYRRESYKTRYLEGFIRIAQKVFSDYANSIESMIASIRGTKG